MTRSHAQWLSASQRVLKETGTIWVIGSYHNIYRVGLHYAGSGILDFERCHILDQNNPMPNFRGVRFTNAHETMIWAQKNRAPGIRSTTIHESIER
jgi:DNA modification methylase